MKYIKTKDGIYEVVCFDEECIIPSPIIKMNGRFTHCSEYKSYKQADTIEELCDEFIYEYNSYSKHEMCQRNCITGLWCDYSTELLLNEKERLSIKGAIWTSKGLIYVAKMNKEGELELI